MIIAFEEFVAVFVDQIHRLMSGFYDQTMLQKNFSRVPSHKHLLHEKMSSCSPDHFNLH